MSEMRSGEKLSSFSATCSRLSQFLKEKRTFSDLGLGIAPRAPNPPKGVFRPPTTMNLLPGVDVSADTQTDTEDNVSDRNATKSMDLFPQHTGFVSAVPAEDDAGKKPDTMELEKTQLTIFYGGKVFVYDDFPAAKAKELIQMASRESSTTRNPGSAIPSPASGVAADRPPASISGSQPRRPSQPSVSDLPIARRASLHRFLEKRKDRINSTAPYQVKGYSSAEPGAAPEWLGLGPRVSKLSSESGR